MVAASDRDGVIFSLSAGNHGDGPEGRTLLQRLGPTDHPVYLLMDRAYKGGWNENLGGGTWLYSCFSTKTQSKNPWAYDKELYKRRNQVERLLRRIKWFRHIFTRYDKLDIIFLAFVYFALIIDALMWAEPKSYKRHKVIGMVNSEMAAPEREPEMQDT